MRIFIFPILFSFFSLKGFAQQIFGLVTNDGGVSLSSVLVVNTNTNAETYTDAEGKFLINANIGDEIRFVKTDYYRNALKLTSENFNQQLKIWLEKIPKEIEEVKIYGLTGDLNKDARLLQREDKVYNLQRSLGLPKPPEKLREKPAEVKEVLLPLLLGQLNTQKVYDLVSGKARRQKNLYRYDDLQDQINWIRKRLDNSYFIKAGIPENRISEFIQFSFYVNPRILNYLKAKNISGIMLEMETIFPIYLEKLKNS